MQKQTLALTSVIGSLVVIWPTLPQKALAAVATQKPPVENASLLLAKYPEPNSELGQKIEEALRYLETDIDDFRESLEDSSLDRKINDRAAQLRREVDQLHDSFRDINGRDRDQIEGDLDNVLSLRRSLNNSIRDWRFNNRGNNRRDREVLANWWIVDRYLFIVEFLLQD